MTVENAASSNSHFIKFSFSNLWKNKIHSLVHITALTLSLAFFFLICVYVQYEHSFDKFHKNYRRIYRVEGRLVLGDDETQKQATTPLPLAQSLADDVSGIEKAARISRPFEKTLLTFDENRKFMERQGIWTDSSFFQIFSFSFIEGDPASALSQPRSVVLTRSLAQKYFPDESSIGKAININNLSDWKVSAVIEDVPSNSHFNFRFILSSDYAQRIPASWESSTVFTYILLEKNESQKGINEKIRTILREKGGVLDKEVYLKPLSKIHLKSNVFFEFQNNNSKKTLSVFMAMALTLLFFVSLSLLISSRTLSDESKNEEFKKIRTGHSFFLKPSILISLELYFISALLALFAVILCLDWFGQVVNSELKVINWIFLVISVVGSILIVSVPVVMASFIPGSVDKERKSPGSTGAGVFGLLSERFVLGLHFFLLIAVILAAFTIARQVDYLKKGRVGIAKEDILILNFPNLDPDTINRLAAFQNELLRYPNILSSSFSFSVPFDIHGTSLVRSENMEENDRVLVNVNFINTDFLDTFELEVVEDISHFSQRGDIAIQEWVCIINESAARKFGWIDLRNRGETLLGKRVIFNIANRPPIATIVKDFPSSFQKDRAEPLIMILNQRRASVYPYFAVKLFPGEQVNTIEFIRNKYGIIFPNDVFDSRNFEKLYARVYQDEVVIKRVFLIFLVLVTAVFLTVLLGISPIRSRRKTVEYLKVFLAANVVAWPSAYLILNSWLRKFAFRSEISFWLFVLAGLLAFAVAALTFSMREIRSFKPIIKWIVFYVVVLLIVKPQLIYYGFGRLLELPLFSTNRVFLQESLFQVGGLTGFFSGFLSQFYVYSLLGALIITFVAWSLSRVSGTLIWQFVGVRSQILCYLPALFFFMIYNRYDHPLKLSLALLSALLFTVLFEKIKLPLPYVKGLLFVCMSGVLYMISGGASLLFVILAVFGESYKRKRHVVSGIYLFIGALIPLVLGTIVFGLTAEETFLRLLPFHADEMSRATALLAQGLFLSIPVVIAALVFWQASGRRSFLSDMLKPRSKNEENRQKRGFQIIGWEYLKEALPTILLCLLFIVAISLSFDKEKRTFHKFIYYSQLEKWSDVLKEADSLPEDVYNIFAHYQINRALFHTGQLKEDMFAFQQYMDTFALIPTEEERFAVIDVAISDITFEMGALNIAEHLNLELMEIMGESPALLYKLSHIHLAKGQVDTARVFLKALKKDWLYGRKAANLLQQLEIDPQLKMERQTQFLRSVLLTENLANINEETMLLELLKKNRYNQMAFEFLMARYLMERNVEKIVENLDHFRDFGYREIPTLYEEAILLYENKTEEKVDLRGRHIRPETIERFRKFTEVISSSTLQAREFAATEFTREFGRSYFFYYVFDASGVDR